jgi:hypothetical protein
MLIMAIRLVEDNNSLYLAVLNNNNIERIFGRLKYLSG